MAQESRGLWKRARILAHRYGITGRASIAIVCSVMIALAAAVGIWHVTTPELVMIQRGDDLAAKDGPSVEKANVAGDASGSRSQESESTTDAPSVAVVHIDGAVAMPGVYRVEGESPRIDDVVSMAGGLLPDADTTNVNLAAVVADGSKVHIPLLGESGAEVLGAVQDVVMGGQPTEAVPSSNADGLININSATVEELKTLSGVGDATAAAIVEDREANGPFASTEELMRVSGIGEKKYAKLKDRICVG